MELVGAHLQHRSVVSGLLLFGVVFFRVDDPTPIPALLMVPLDPNRKGDDFLRGEAHEKGSPGLVLLVVGVQGNAVAVCRISVGVPLLRCGMRILNRRPSRGPCIYWVT